MKKKIIFIIILLFILLSIIIYFSFNNISKLDSNIDKNLEAATSPLSLTASKSSITNQIDLSWTIENSANYMYRCFQSIGGSSFQSISSTDFSDGSYIKVLNVYPNTGNNLKSWMETNGYGKGIMQVTPVSISNFNSNPTSYLKDSNGNWIYDVIVFGFWDSNNSCDLSSTSASLVESYILTGRGVIFGHDTVSTYCGHPYFASLAKYINMTTNNSYTYAPTTSITLSRKGIFTTFPWNIGVVGTILNIPSTHDVDQAANGDIWVTLNNGISGNRNFYLTTYNNCAMIQTGHSSGAATDDEQKILANLIFYMKQLTAKNALSDYSALDNGLPNSINDLNVSYIDNQKAQINFTAVTDTGTDYSYYVQAISKLDNSVTTSNTVTQSSGSGVLGYSYIINSSSTANSSEIDSTPESSTPNFSIDLTNNINWFEDVYLHISSVDKAGNVSSPSNIKLTPQDNIIFSYTKTMSNNSKTNLVGAISSKGITNITLPSLKDSNSQIDLNVSGKNRLSLDYPISSDTTVIATVTLSDGTKINKEVSLKK